MSMYNPMGYDRPNQAIDVGGPYLQVTLTLKKDRFFLSHLNSYLTIHYVQKSVTTNIITQEIHIFHIVVRGLHLLSGNSGSTLL